MIVAGGGVRVSSAGPELVALAEALQIPVATSLNGKDAIPGTHPLSVGVVAEGKYLFRDGVRDLKAVFDREVKQNKWIEEHLAKGTQVGEYRTTGEYSFRSKYCAGRSTRTPAIRFP